MTREPDDLVQVSAAVSDGAAVDWRRLEAGSDAEHERMVLRQLHVISEIARWHASVADSENGEATVISEPRDAVRRAQPDDLERWGHLERRETVGHGAFGTVYRAWDTTLHREV